MFGLSFGELCVLLIVAMIVIGPKELPKVLRKIGYYSGKVRRFAFDMRAQSGIDDALRTEGLDKDIAEIRKLARGELDGVVAATRDATRIPSSYGSHSAPAALDDPNAVVVERDREIPRDGPDSYGALPDTAIVYAEGLPVSVHAHDPIYMQDDVKPAPETKSEAPTTAEAGASGDAKADAAAVKEAVPQIAAAEAKAAEVAKAASKSDAPAEKATGTG